jgi:translation initiation factor IF-1
VGIDPAVSHLTESDERDRNGRGVAGTIIELLPRSTFRVKLETEQEIIAHTAGATVTNFVRLRPGDRVEIEISSYDRTRGRITKLWKD